MPLVPGVPEQGLSSGEAVAAGLPPEAAVQCVCGARLTLRTGHGQLRTASGLERAARVHTAGAGSLLSLVCVVERGGRRWTGLVAAVRGRSVPCLHVGGVLASFGPFVGKWQPWEGGLVRLYGLGEVGGGGALRSQQDCGVSGTEEPPPRPPAGPSALEQVSHSRECICPRPLSSLFRFTYSVPRFGDAVSSTSMSTSLSWQRISTGGT